MIKIIKKNHINTDYKLKYTLISNSSSLNYQFRQFAIYPIFLEFQKSVVILHFEIPLIRNPSFRSSFLIRKLHSSIFKMLQNISEKN